MSDDTPDMPEGQSKIRSLHEQRKKKNEQARKTYLPVEQRVLELEADMIRIIDSLADLDGVHDYNSRISRLLVKAVSHLAGKVEKLEAEISKSRVHSRDQ